jgi:uncharacterized membrane protein
MRAINTSILSVIITLVIRILAMRFKWLRWLVTLLPLIIGAIAWVRGLRHHNTVFPSRRPSS